MRSVYLKILVWCFAALLLSLGAFMMVTRFVSGAAARGKFITDVHALQTAEAEEAYEAGGSAGLAVYLKRLHRFMREHDYVTDAQGKDLATGEDRSALLRLARPISEPPVFRILLVHPEKGLTGVLLIESDKPTTSVPATPEEVERVRADLERRRAARLLWKGGATDTNDCAPA
jgi:hypothetical protein